MFEVKKVLDMVSKQETYWFVPSNNVLTWCAKGLLTVGGSLVSLLFGGDRYEAHHSNNYA